MQLRSNNGPVWVTVFFCHFLFTAAFVSSAWGQIDGDDLLLMVPAIVAKSQQQSTATTTPSNPAPNPEPEEPENPDSLTSLERMLLDAHNQARASSRRCGGILRSAAPALEWDARLALADQVHSSDMNRTGVFDHTGSDGSSASQRATREGYSWSAIAENIAGGYPTVQSAVDALLTSTGHCNNIMGSRYVDFGAAKVGRYWTMVFARPG